MTKRYLPVGLDLEGQNVLVVGAGKVAEGKVDQLLDVGARVRLIAPDATPHLTSLAADGRIAWDSRPFEPADVLDAWIVIAASDDRSANAAVADAARAAGRLVNAVDDVPNCDFIAMSLLHRGELQVAISTGGGSPAMARYLREYLEEVVPEEMGDLLAALAEVRAERKAKGAVPPYATWKQAIDYALSHPTVSSALEKGSVALVGAGPGDPGLLTLNARDRLARADVVVYDHLVDDRVLAYANPRAQLVFAGKTPGRHHLPQEEINALLVELARSGHAVVRLKGGDPFVFGRGGEEAAALAEAGVPFEVVPGVSSAIAAPAYAGIPVTHRDHASAVTIVTGHECAANDGSIKWDELGRSGATLVILMGMANLPCIVERLRAAGRPADEPVAVVQNASRPDQRAVVATLDDVVARVAEAGLGSPAVIVVGPVARLHDQLSWFAPPAQRQQEVVLA